MRSIGIRHRSATPGCALFFYLRRNLRDSEHPRPIQGASMDAVLLDMRMEEEPASWEQLVQTVNDAGAGEALIVMQPGGSVVPESLEQHVHEWAGQGGTWVFGAEAGDAVAAVSLVGEPLSSDRLRGLLPMQGASPALTSPDAPLTARPTVTQLQGLLDQQRDLVAQAVTLTLRELDRRDRDTSRVLIRQAAKTSAAYAATSLSRAQRALDPERLLSWAVQAAPRDGLYLEFGVYQGRTITQIAHQHPGRVHGFDSFEGLPEDWRPGFPAGAFGASIPPVPDNMTLVKGWFSDTLPSFMESHTGPVAIAHIDCDLYSSTMTVLDAIGPRLVPGSVLCFDEYFNYPGWEEHEHRAWLEAVADRGFDFEYLAYVPDGEQVAVRLTAVGDAS